MRHIILSAACAALFWFAAEGGGVETRAADVYVDNVAGSDDNSGKASETPLRTLAKAASLLRPGDRLLLAANDEPYCESLILRGIRSNVDNPLVIEGNGAVLSGLQRLDAAGWRKREGGLYAYPAWKLAPHCLPSLFANGSAAVPAAKDADILPGGWRWEGEEILYRPEPGADPATLAISVSMRDSGLAIVDSSNIIVHNLVAERFYNDGFNIHGDCQGLVFHNITGRFNGDDGFSIHEDGGAYVWSSHFHDNTYGIQDINASRSYFNGVLVNGNRFGVHFSGGMHELVNCTIVGNREFQVRVNPGAAAGYLGADRHVGFYAGKTFIKDSWIEGGARGLLVQAPAKAGVLNSVLRGSVEGVRVEAGAFLWLRGSVFSDCAAHELFAAEGVLLSDCNIFQKGHISYAGKNYDSGELAGYSAASGQDANSRVLAPEFTPEGLFKNAPRLEKMLPGPKATRYHRAGAGAKVSE